MLKYFAVVIGILFIAVALIFPDVEAQNWISVGKAMFVLAIFLLFAEGEDEGQ